jgi:hypothetical protein
LAAAIAGDTEAPGQLFELLALGQDGGGMLLAQMAARLSGDPLQRAITADPLLAQDVVSALRTAHSAERALAPGGEADVSDLIRWLLEVAHRADDLDEWDLLDLAVDAIAELVDDGTAPPVSRAVATGSPVVSSTPQR